MKNKKDNFSYRLGALKRSLKEKADQPGALIQAAKKKTLSKRDVAIRGLI
jgi:hypothetical protein